MAKQHKFAAAVTVTENVARVRTLTYSPNVGTVDDLGNPSTGMVIVTYDIGEETAGVFTKTSEAQVQAAYADLSGALQLTFDDLETKSLNFAQNAGLIPAGTEEPVP